jgi:hypothetical protein
MYRFLIFFIFITSSFVYANMLEFKPFSSYDKAIAYINNNQDFIQEKEETTQTQYKSKEKVYNPYTDKEIEDKPYQSKPKPRISNIFATSCKTPRLLTREYYTDDMKLYSFENGSSIRYKYSPSDIDKEFFIVLKDFSPTDIKDILLPDKKRFVIQTKLINKTIHKKMTNVDGVKRLELGIVKNRKYPMYIVLQSYDNESIIKCDVLLKKRGSSSLTRYKAHLLESNNYDIVYKIYVGN